MGRHLQGQATICDQRKSRMSLGMTGRLVASAQPQPVAHILRIASNSYNDYSKHFILSWPTLSSQNRAKQFGYVNQPGWDPLVISVISHNSQKTQS